MSTWLYTSRYFWVNWQQDSNSRRPNYYEMSICLISNVRFLPERKDSSR